MKAAGLLPSTAVLILTLATLSQAGHAAEEGATLSIAGRSNAHVSLASEGSVVAAVWAASAAGGETDIMAAVSRDGGRSFTAPVRVNAVAGDARVNGEQPPRITLSTERGAVPRITVVWTAKGVNGTRLHWSSSADAGRTFAPTQLVADTDAAGNRGWEAVAAAPGGRVFTAWLDHRKLASSGAMPSGHQHGASATPTASTDGADMAQLSQLYVAPIDGRTPAVPVTGGVCYCCKTALVASGSQLFVAWRHVYAGNMRDIAFSASRDAGRTFASPVRVSEDRWQIAGCPDDGPTMALDAQGRVHIVWPSVVTEGSGPVKALFHAVSSDGKSFSPRTRVPTEGQAHHPQLSIDATGAAVLVWDETGKGVRRLAAATARADATGRLEFRRRGPSLGVGSYPVVIPAPSGWLAAWTEGAPGSTVIRLAQIPRTP